MIVPYWEQCKGGKKDCWTGCYRAVMGIPVVLARVSVGTTLWLLFVMTAAPSGSRKPTVSQFSRRV